MATSDLWLRIAVLGDKGCGKSTFIEAFYSENERGEFSETENYRMYPCKIMVQNRMLNVSIYEISCQPELTDLYNVLRECQPHRIVLMYANSHLSYRRAYDVFAMAIGFWKPNSLSYLLSALVGTYTELPEQENEAQNPNPRYVQPHYPEGTVKIVCSNDLQEMKDAWEQIFGNMQELLNLPRQ